MRFIGSEKQIRWAKKIRKNAHKVMQQAVKTAAIRVDEKNMPSYWLACVLDTIKAVQLGFDCQNKAEYWINNRNDIIHTANHVDALAGKKYKLLYQKYGAQEITLQQYQEF